MKVLFNVERSRGFRASELMTLKLVKWPLKDQKKWLALVISVVGSD